MTESEQYLINGVLPNPLTKQEEEVLLQKYFVEHDETAREQLIFHNLRLIPKVLRKHFPMLDMNESFSIGVLAIVRALDYFKYETNSKALSTFLYVAIKTEYCKLIVTQGRQKRQGTVVSLDELGIEISARRQLEYNQFEEKIVDKIICKKAVEQIKVLLERMDERAKRIFMKYHSSENKAACIKKLVEQEGISQQRVHQILNRTAEKIKQKFPKGLYDEVEL